MAVEAARKYPDKFCILGWFPLDSPESRSLINTRARIPIAADAWRVPPVSQFALRTMDARLKAQSPGNPLVRAQRVMAVLRRP